MSGAEAAVFRRRETLTAKERVRLAFSHREPDRVPIDYASNPVLDAKLKARLGLEPGDDEGLRLALGVDFRGIAPRYTGAALHPQIPGRRVDPQWGMRTRWIEHGSGGYWDVCDFPLRDAGVDEVAAWPLPSPEHFDYDGLVDACRARGSFALYVGDGSMGCVMNRTGRLRSMEQMFVDLATDDPAGLLLVDRMDEIRLGIVDRTLRKVGGMVDYLWLGEDLGTQRGPIVSMELYRRHLRPRHKRYIDLAKGYGLKVIMHSCGSSSWAFEELIALGVDVVETIQPEARDMAPAYLKATWGDRLCFHGGISTAGALAFGTPQEVTDTVRETLAIMMPGGGYCLAPTHMMQDNTPLENAVEMYRAAHEYGYYG
jgi:uroporphyrinogen decarboxylase